MRFFFIKIIFICIAFSSCVKQDDSGGIASLGQSLPPCPSDTLVAEDCLVAAGASAYYYDSPYGGRSPLITSPINAADNSPTEVLPTGWYQGVTINFSSSVLSPAVISDNVTVFGSVGGLNSAANPACILPGLQSSNCSASNGHFLFSTPYGGRGSNCTNYDNGATNSICWVQNTGYTIDNSPGTNSPACVGEGLQGSNCTAPINSYYYQNELGGRALDCSSGYNASACWVATIGKFLTDSANSCVDNALNGVTCGTEPGRYVYDDPYGGRDTDCTNDITGSCYVTQASKALLEPALKPENIKMGVNIFGVLGQFAGQGDWYSTAHRNQETAPVTQLAESTVYAGIDMPAGYRGISSITRDDDGYQSTEVTPVNRTGWGTTSCGTTQPVLTDRIDHCEAVFGNNSSWDGSIQGNAGQMRWRLVTRTGATVNGKGREVWIDSKTGLLWSSLVSKSINWCKAIGSSNNAGVNIRYREDDPNNICDQDANQNNTAGLVISACVEGVGFGTDADVDSGGKAGMALAATVNSPAVAWRAPTFYDYEVADAHGIRFVLPDIGTHLATEEWMATTVSTDTNKAWTYTGDSGLQLNKTRNTKVMARCIGR